jgi:23S rRNA pseudouridine955/2504/2580 synthase
VGDDGQGQRVDNYLVKILKGVPKSHIYRILRSGEVRVNGGRSGRTRGSRRATSSDPADPRIAPQAKRVPAAAGGSRCRRSCSRTSARSP